MDIGNVSISGYYYEVINLIEGGWENRIEGSEDIERIDIEESKRRFKRVEWYPYLEFVVCIPRR